MSKETLRTKTNQLDIQLGLNYYIPSLLKLIEGQIRWSSLHKILNKRFIHYEERYMKGERFELRMSIYSLTIAAAKGHLDQINFLNFIDDLFKSLDNCLTSGEKKIIKATIGNLLEYGDEFLDFLGELCILNYLMKSGQYNLNKTEHRLRKYGKGIDFMLTNKKTNKSLLIEVVNIELREDKLIDHIIIQKFLTGKIQDKLDDTDKTGITNYILMPVIWGGRDSVENILKVKDFYEKVKFSINRVQIPMVYMQLQHEQRIINRFSSILNCLDKSV